jgi:threonine/homoserine/homoserine lactone efflux protein
MLSILAHGFVTGLLLQVAVGPVFFFVLNTTLQGRLVDGLCAVAAVTLADCVYIFLAAAGAGSLLARPRIAFPLRVGSSIVLAAFGVTMIAAAARAAGGAASVSASAASIPPGALASFLSALVLTLSSPLTIVFWTGIFAARASDAGYTRRQLFPFGAAAAASTAVFLGTSTVVVSFLRSAIPPAAASILNGVVGVVLVAYGAWRMVGAFRRRHPGAVGAGGQSVVTGETGKGGAAG